jgi:D-glucuronyl C5-epimerase-like protein
VSSGRRMLLTLAAATAVLAAAAPARAASVIVDGDRALRREDPLVPARSKSDLGLPPKAPPQARASSASRGSSARGPSPAERRASSARRRRAVASALLRALRQRGISRASYRRHLRTYRRARAVQRRLRRARRRQLGYVIASIDRIAARGRLTPSRIPGLFLQLRRNTQYWARLPYPRAGDRVTFRRSEILFQYYPGRGLQIQPLATFVKANLMHGACVGVRRGPCRRAGFGRLLDEMAGIAVQRTRGFIAWEYFFAFGGGAPPWISGMAQATGIQAYARGSQLLGRPDYVQLGARALGAFEAGPPLGVRTGGPAGGVHYLQYSFAPRLYIFNAFVQARLGLYDYGTITGDPRAMALFSQAEPEGQREVPLSDTGRWSLYSYRGRKSTPEYHELLREVLQSMCSRGLGDVYCRYAERYRRYQALGFPR